MSPEEEDQLLSLIEELTLLVQELAIKSLTLETNLSFLEDEVRSIRDTTV